MYRQKYAVLDIETNTSHDTIWMAGLYFPESGTSTHVTSSAALYEALSDTECIIGHNLLGFDIPVLKRVWDFEFGGEVRDTLVMGRLFNPSIETVYRHINGKPVSMGAHSLRAWAIRAGGELKSFFDTEDFDGGLTQEMIDYCLQDCRSNWDVYQYLVKELEDAGFSQRSIELEHFVREATTEQEQNGFYFDFNKACSLYANHTDRMAEIEHELQELFPPIVTERYSEKTGKRLKDHVEVFNVGSRQQVAKRLSTLGAKWTRQTPTGKPVVDEVSLKENSHIPQAALVLEYMTLQKRVGMLKSWIDNVQDDDRIHGSVNTCGAVTGRMTHSKPNLAQVPSSDENDPSTWGYRECFTVPEGHKLVGVDASGLELRMLAHYMNDSDYTELILNGDIHTYNQNAAGLDTRPQAKTFIYAFLYGAGDAKIGSITGGGAKEGAALKAKFLESLPALEQLLSKVDRLATRHGSLPGLDGRRVLVRSSHAALNTLLQSAGAIVMKEALRIATLWLREHSIPYKLVAQVHDEFQIEAPEDYALVVGQAFRDAIVKAGESLELRCPLDGEYKIGKTWRETH